MGLSATVVRDRAESMRRHLSAHIEKLTYASGRVNQVIEIWKNRIELTAN